MVPSRAQDIIDKAQKGLVRERIRVVTSKIGEFERIISKEKNDLFTKFSEDNTLQQTLSEHFKQAHNKIYDSSKLKQKGKLQKLTKKKEEKRDTIDLSGEQLKKWVVNVSKKDLTTAETTVLAKGLNFAVAPQKIPVEEYIVETEKACGMLGENEREQLRAEMRGALKSTHPPQQNITKAEREALKDLKKDDKITILPADKGRATVVMDAEMYEVKVKEMLGDERTYQKLKTDPTPKYKKKLVTILNRLKDEKKLTPQQHRYLAPTSQNENIPRLYCTPKIHKAGNPLRPIVDYTGTIAYNVSRSLADLLGPLVGKTKFHVKNSKHLAEDLREVILEDDEMLCSHDVVSLFTNTPIPQALEIIRERLTEDATLKKRTLLSVPDIMELLEFVLTTTYFTFRGQIYQQKFGTAMGSPVSPIVANLFMEDLEQEAIASAPVSCRPRFWKRYVDDTLEVIKKGEAENLTQHLNTIDSTGSIKFTYEAEEKGSIAFLDTLLVRREDGSIKLKVYRKKTHTNQYLAFSSHHPLHQKMGVIRTLMDRCEGIVTELGDKQQERDTIRTALKTCGYPEWTMGVVKQQMDNREERKEEKKSKRKERQDQDKSRGMVILPYVKGLSEKVARLLKKRKINAAMRPHTTLRQLLVHPKDKVDPGEGVYTIDCGNCEKKYIGETKRKLCVRVKEHREDVEKIDTGRSFTRDARKQSETERHKSAITDHVCTSNHVIKWDSAKVVQKEADWKARGIKEAVTIRKHPENMNRDEGRYQLSHLYDDLLRPVLRD